MTESMSRKRMAQNEVVFRKANKRVLDGIAHLKTIAAEDNVSYEEFDQSTALEFLCECSDENCRQRLTMTIAEYKEAHERSPRSFVIAKGHDVPLIESVVHAEPEFVVVLKHEMPPTSDAQGLLQTDVDNTPSYESS